MVIDTIAKRKYVLSLILLEIQNVKIIKRFAKVKLFGCAVFPRLLKIEFLQSIYNQKIVGVTIYQ